MPVIMLMLIYALNKHINTLADLVGNTLTCKKYTDTLQPTLIHTCRHQFNLHSHQGYYKQIHTETLTTLHNTTKHPNSCIVYSNTAHIYTILRCSYTHTYAVIRTLTYNHTCTYIVFWTGRRGKERKWHQPPVIVGPSPHSENDVPPSKADELSPDGSSRHFKCHPVFCFSQQWSPHVTENSNILTHPPKVSLSGCHH